MANRTNSILVVDDYLSWRDLLVEVMFRDGHHVISASNFIEAKKLLEVEVFDILICDIRLIDKGSNYDGLVLLRYAKEEYNIRHIVMLTGYPDEEQKKRSFEYGCDYYLEKAPNGSPFDVDSFSKLIFSLVQ